MLNKKLALLVSILVAVLVVSSNATIFQQMSYQGILTDSSGNRITGTRTLTFKIYTTASGRTACWEESQVLNIQDGVVNVLLGSSTPISGCDATQQWWIEITVSGDSPMDRIQLTAVSYSMNADKLDGQDASAFAASAHNHDGTYVKLGVTNSNSSYTLIDGGNSSSPLLGAYNSSNSSGSKGLYGRGYYGVYGEGGNYGIYGTNASESRKGGLGTSGYGVWGWAETISGYAGYFEGSVLITGDLTVDGNKQFIHPHPTDPTKNIIYVCLEGGEAGTYIRGSAQLNNGTAVIDLPEHFGLVTGPKGLTVQITPRDVVASCYLYAESVTPTSLVVKEANNGTSDAKFDYLVQGIRIGYEDHQPIQTKER